MSILNHWLLLLVATCPILTLARISLAEDVKDGNAQRRIMVAPFENKSGVHAWTDYSVASNKDPNRPNRSIRIDRYAEAPRERLEDLIVNMDGVTVVERQRVDSMLMEGVMSNYSGLADEGTAVKIGKLLGANTIVMGSISDIVTATKSFEGNGIKSKMKIVTGTVRIRIIDITTGTVVGSAMYDASAKYLMTSFGGQESTDVATDVIKSAIDQLKADTKFLDKIAGRSSASAGPTVKVEFSPTPEKCDISVDGEYQGSSPATIALPSGKALKVELSKAGYKPWSHTLTPRDGLKVTPELEKTDAATSASTNSKK